MQKHRAREDAFYNPLIDRSTGGFFTKHLLKNQFFILKLYLEAVVLDSFFGKHLQRSSQCHEETGISFNLLLVPQVDLYRP